MNSKFSNKKIILSGNAIIYSIGLSIGILTTIFLMGIFSFVLTLFDFNETTVNVLGVVSLVVGSFIGSFYIGNKLKRRGLLIGVIIGFINLFLVEMLSLMFGKFDFNLLFLVKILLVLFSSLAGGIYAVNKVAKRRI